MWLVFFQGILQWFAINTYSSSGVTSNTSKKVLRQNMLMWELWQGKGKLPFNVYFDPFASEMIENGMWVL